MTMCGRTNQSDESSDSNLGPFQSVFPKTSWIRPTSRMQLQVLKTKHLGEFLQQAFWVGQRLGLTLPFRP